MKKAVFFDIDGTLWDSENHIPESAVTAIRGLRSQGHYAFLCSGRARAYIQNPKLFDIGFDGVLAGCGTHVEIDGKIIYEKRIGRELAIHTVETVRKYGFRPILEGPNYLYMDAEDFAHEPYGKKVMRELGGHLVGIRENYGNWEINKLSCATDHADRAGGFAALAEHYTYLIHNSSVVELVPRGHTKATGIAKVCEYLQIDRNDTFAVGDSVNDLEMLTCAGTGIAMGNADRRAKRAADYVTTDLYDDGIYNAMLHFGLLPAENDVRKQAKKGEIP